VAWLWISTAGNYLWETRGNKVSRNLPLALFVARVTANDVNHAAAADNLAVIANALHAGADLHGTNLAATWLEP
jgi:hypothetical protein